LRRQLNSKAKKESIPVLCALNGFEKEISADKALDCKLLRNSSQ